MLITRDSSDMLALFDPPINEIIKLVESQVNAAKSNGEKIDVRTIPSTNKSELMIL